jgi:hypothetical protein
MGRRGSLPSVVLAVGAVSMVVSMVAGCSDGSEPAASSSTVTSPTVTTVIMTAAPTTTIPTTAAVPTTTMPTTTVPPATVATTKATTTAPTTTTAKPTTTTAAKATTTTAAGFTLYTPVPAPVMPETSAPIPAPGTALPDGVYYATFSGAGTVTGQPVRLSQWFGGAACEAAAARNGDECLNDYYVLSTPERVASLDLTGAFVSVADMQPGTSFRVSAAELVRLVKVAVETRTSPPGTTGAPAGFRFTAFSARVEVRGGTVARLEQVWTP